MIGRMPDWTYVVNWPTHSLVSVCGLSSIDTQRHVAEVECMMDNSPTALSPTLPANSAGKVFTRE